MSCKEHSKCLISCKAINSLEQCTVRIAIYTVDPMHVSELQGEVDLVQATQTEGNNGAGSVDVV